MPHSFPHQAILLAAGLGTRLRPLTVHRPKPALPVGGVPLLAYNLYLLYEAGIHDIVVNLHHRPEILVQMLSPLKKHMNLRFSHEQNILGTGGGIAQALKKLPPTPTWVLNGDILFPLDLKDFWRHHQHQGNRVTLACVSPQLAAVESFVEYDSKQKIRRIAGAPKTDSKPSTLSQAIFSGAHLLDPALFADLDPHRFSCVVRQVYQPALARGESFGVYLHKSDWWDLGSLSQLKEVDQKLWIGSVKKQTFDFYQKVHRWTSSWLSKV